MTELIIDETNFNEYFFDATKHNPKKGQVLACFEATAEFVDGDLKRDIVNSILFKDQTESIISTLQTLGFASYKESVKIIKNIVNDFLSGMSIFEILDKPYEYQVKMLYYTQKEYVPKNDYHWSTIQTLEYINISDYDKDTIREENEH